MALERTIKIKVDSKGAEKSINRLDKSVENLGDSAEKTTKDFGALKASVIAVGAALNVALIAKYADEFTSIQNVIRQTTNGTRELTQRTGELLEVANRSRVGLKETSDLYQNLVLSTEELNLSTEKQVRITETIVKSFAVSGKSAAESAGAITQLSQAFAAGTLRGDEFNSIAEGAPEIMRALQRSLKMTQGELRAFAATGGITAEKLVTALDGAADVIDLKLSKATTTLAQSMKIAENNAIAFVGTSDLITNSMGLAGETITKLSENLDFLANTLLVAATLGLGRLNAMLVINTVEWAKNTAAKITNTTATKFVNNGINFTTASLTRQTLAMRLATVAATGLKGAYAFLGGSVGVITLAATALILWNSTAETSEDKAKKLKGAVADLADEYTRTLNIEQQRVKLHNAVETVRKLEIEHLEKTKALNEQIKNIGQGKGDAAFSKAKRMQAELDVLSEKIAKARLESAALFDAGLSIGRTPTGGDQGEKKTELSDEKFSKELEKQEAHQQALFDSMVLFEEQKAQFLADKERANREASEISKDIVTENNRAMFSDSLSFFEQFSRKSKVLAKGLVALRAAEGVNSALINSQVAATRALAELGPIAGPPAAASMITYGKLSAAFIAANGILSISGGGSGGGGTSISRSTSGAGSRQNPVSPDRNIDFGGLKEVAGLLRDLDPQEVLPVEYTQRIVASLENLERLGG